jgi:acetylornithine deacetylase/succinyl-diaminopimelate desuccinylase-like protein
VNAVDAMADVLRAARDIELPSHPELVGAILVPTEIVSRPYPALSVVPDLCGVIFDRRTLPGEHEADVLAQLRTVAEAAVAPHGATVEVEIGVDRFDSHSGAPVEAPNFAAAWFTPPDLAATVIDALGTERTHWLFCTNGLAHRVDEYVELDELHAGARAYATLAAALTAQ